MKKIIMLSGRARAGKNTTADTLHVALESKGHKVKQLAFADVIKNFCKQHLHWNGVKDKEGRQLLITVGTYILREYWTFEYTGIKGNGLIVIDENLHEITPRFWNSYSQMSIFDRILNFVFKRKYYGYKYQSLPDIYSKCKAKFVFSNTIFVDEVIKYMLEYLKDFDYFIITDHRFLVEYDTVKSKFGKDVITTRIARSDVHNINDISENELNEFEVDHILNNDGTHDELKAKVDEYIKGVLND